jgi:hypothetical protein
MYPAKNDNRIKNLSVDIPRIPATRAGLRALRRDAGPDAIWFNAVDTTSTKTETGSIRSFASKD